MGTQTNTTASPDPAGREFAVRYVIRRVSRTVDDLYRSADGLCCDHPEAAKRIRELAGTLAGSLIDSLRHWPS